MTGDPTNIIQRKSLFDKLDTFMEAHRNHGTDFALLLVNIDRFRQFNIIHGFEVGDYLLAEIYKRLLSLAREQDYIVRAGNADFVIVIQNVYNEGHATLAVTKLLTGLGKPFFADNSPLTVSANVGVALYPGHGQNASELLKSAETALVESRRKMPAYSIYSEPEEDSSITSWDISSELQTAIDLDQFELFFQPQIHLATGRVFGAEALIRWKHPDRGYVRPDYFIPVAEQSNQIIDITNWTLRSSLWMIREWPETAEPMKVSVNISPKFLESHDHDLAEIISGLANIFGTSLNRLTLEVTESALMEDVTSSIQCLEELKALGINISIDDFGTGYSSMAYFKYIPAHELKIDYSFVSNMLKVAMDRHIVKSIIDMAQGFDLVVVAEGVEDQETFDELKTLGCDIAQGYFISKPIPQEEFIEWIKSYNKYYSEATHPG